MPSMCRYGVAMTKQTCHVCGNPLECANCYRRSVAAKGGFAMSEKRMAHMKRMTKARVKAQKERKQKAK